MAKEFAKQFYRSTAWKKCRTAYIEHRVMVDGGLCEVCRDRIGYIVHHKELLTPSNINDPAISLSFSNLQYDCKTCHDREEEHAFIHEKNLNCTFDENGNPTPKEKTKWN